MQVKKFEAQTLQEALDTIKRELGPEAIILQTKQNRKGFGLMSKGSVEVTAAISERATDKKKDALKRMPEAYAKKMVDASAVKQADFYENYLNSKIEKEKVQIANASAQQKRISAVRYADIQDEGGNSNSNRNDHHHYALDAISAEPAIPQYEAPTAVSDAIESYSNSRDANFQGLQEEVSNLKRLVEELRRERKRPEYIDSDSPFSATEALSEAYDLILQSGVDRRFAVQIMREVARNLSVESRADNESVLDAVASQLLKRTDIRPYFAHAIQNGEQSIRALVGVSGSGKTACLAKLATHAVRVRNEKIGIIRIRLQDDEAQDPLIIFAKALHVPYRLVSSAEELNTAIQDMTQANRIFIDTPGLSPKDSKGQRQLKNILQGNAKIHTDLVLSATTRDLELHEQGKSFSALSPDTLFFTRLDETYSFGSIYSLSQRLRLPVSVFTTGKKVTEEWENASAERLTASILNIV
jgi:flagellar biosynthesis protein FlhF